MRRLISAMWKNAPFLILPVLALGLLAMDCGNTLEFTSQYHPAGHRYPQWSPDGDRLVLAYRGGLYVVEVDGSAHERIVDPKRLYGSEIADLNTPNISPNGARIIYSRIHKKKGSFDYELETVAVDGSDQIRLTENGSDEVDPVWSPDGSLIAFLSDRLPHEDDIDEYYRYGFKLYTMAADGSDVRSLAPGVSAMAGVPPVWSPDGSEIRYGGYPVFSANADGSAVQLFGGRFQPTALAAAWSPNSSRVAVSVAHTVNAPDSDREVVLFSMERDGSDKRILLRAIQGEDELQSGEGRPWEPAGGWGPRSEALADQPGEPLLALSPKAMEPCTAMEEYTASCQERDVGDVNLFDAGRGGAGYDVDLDIPSVEEILEKGMFAAEASPVHLAFRGTVRPGSVRCEWGGIARTITQREEAIRFWLGMDGSEALPSPSQVESRFMASVNRMGPSLQDTMRSSLLALARGGLTTEYSTLTCFADYTAQEYLLGAGPSVLTIGYGIPETALSYSLYRQTHASGKFGDQVLISEGEHQASLIRRIGGVESQLGGIVESRESVVFLSPMGAHNAIAVEAWQAVAQWDLQTDDDVVNAVRYGADETDPEYTQTLANLKTRVTTAAAADDFADDRIANVSGLTQYYRDIGAYGDITPDDGSTATFTPAQPPPAMTCAGGTAVTGPAVNRGLVHDCQALLSARDDLRATASLNWAADTVISSWTGVTTGGTPSRITGLALASQSLDGSIPAELGTLFELTSLDLSSNSLTGAIPHELGWLFNLSALKLSGNSLTGCIPIALQNVAVNDLASLNLLYCQPPAPGSVTVIPAAAGIQSPDYVPRRLCQLRRAGWTG